MDIEDNIAGCYIKLFAVGDAACRIITSGSAHDKLIKSNSSIIVIILNKLLLLMLHVFNRAIGFMLSVHNNIEMFSIKINK